MFNNKKYLSGAEYEEKIEKLEKSIKEKDGILDRERDAYYKAGRDNEETIDRIAREQESKDKITENEIAIKIDKATKVTNDELAKAKEALAVARKENEILVKAFENMGFDVKDMKGILDKLVEALVSKNTIQLVK